MTQRQASYNIDDILLFPQGIEIVPYDNVFVAISVETANWIVLYNPVQKKSSKVFSMGILLEKLMKRLANRDFKILKLF